MWTERSKGLAPGKLAKRRAKERLNMCTRAGIKNVYWGDQGLAPGMAEQSECCGISAGLSITLMIQMKEVDQN